MQTRKTTNIHVTHLGRLDVTESFSSPGQLVTFPPSVDCRNRLLWSDSNSCCKTSSLESESKAEQQDASHVLEGEGKDTAPTSAERINPRRRTRPAEPPSVQTIAVRTRTPRRREATRTWRNGRRWAGEEQNSCGSAPVPFGVVIRWRCRPSLSTKIPGTMGELWREGPQSMPSSGCRIKGGSFFIYCCRAEELLGCLGGRHDCEK